MMSVNEILKGTTTITKLNCSLLPPGYKGDVRLMQETISKMIDALGEQSAAAQGLNKVITTAEKVRSSTHTLYLLKDPNAKAGRGELIGMLKVGRKHLFLFDEHDKVCEVEPLCVLDFFVLRNRQRHGYGQVLFDYMLQDNGTTAAELAIDGPSPKMEQFLARHYGIQRLIRQNNNFAVSPSFFTYADAISKSGRSTPVSTPALGRYAAPKPPSEMAMVIHGSESQYHESNGKTSGRVTPVGSKPEPAPAPDPDQKPATRRPCWLNVEPAVASPANTPATSPVGPPATSPVGPPVASPARSPTSRAGSTTTRRDSQLTDRGYFDIKFYHNKLW